MENIKAIGPIHLIIEEDGKNKKELFFTNRVLRSGHTTLCKYLINEQEDKPYISEIIFGDGGAEGRTPKKIHPDRKTLFGITKLNKEIVAQIDPEDLSTLVIAVVVEKNEANDCMINEIALKMSNGDLFSMATFSGFEKTEKMRLTWIWRVLFC